MPDLEDLTKNQQKKLQEKLIDATEDEVEFNISYAMLLIVSAVIATLGLLVNSTAAVIGAMIIAPIFWPVMGTILSVLTSRRNLIGRSIKLLALSMIIVITIAYAITSILPFNEVSSEIEARINPTIIDLFIALAFGVIGVSAVYFPKISSNSTGVAISLSLVPPLAVSGIGLAFGDLLIFQNSLLLFAANVAGMVFAGIVTLYILKFRPHRESEEKRLKFGLAFTVLVMIVLSFPLSLFLKEQIVSSQIQKSARTSIIKSLDEISSDIVITNIKIVENSLNRDALDINATLYIPESIVFTKGDQEEILKKLGEELNKSVNVTFDLINTIEIAREEDANAKVKRTEIEKIVSDELLKIINEKYILNINVSLEGGTYVSVQLKDDGVLEFSYDDKLIIEKALAEKLNEEIGFNIELIPIRNLDNNLDSEKEQSILETLNSLFKENFIILYSDINPSEYLYGYEANIMLVAKNEHKLSDVEVDEAENLLQNKFKISVQINAQLLQVDELGIENKLQEE